MNGFRKTILVLCFIPAVMAQSNWAAVQAVPEGSLVRILMKSGESVRGQLDLVSDTRLVVNEEKGQRIIAQPDIARVWRKKQGHRGRNTLIGLGVGAAGGLAVGAGVDAADHCTSFCILGNNPGKMIFTPLGAIVGVVVGAVLPTGGWSNVYAAP